MEKKKSMGALAFLPLLVFLGCYVGCGLVFTVMGVESAFSYFPRHAALLAALAVALVMGRDTKVDKKLEVFCQGMADSGVMLMILIYFMAGGFQGAAAAMGGKESVVNMCLTFIPVQFLIPGVFIVCCLISTAIGTSMGTIAAMAPVAIGVAQGAGLNAAMCCAAVIGGSYFGDNLSMISDTTISAAQGCGSSMRDKFKTNFTIAVPAAVVAIVIYAILGGAANGTVEIGSFNPILALPYVVVLVTALMGINVAVVLFIGIAMTGVIGLAMGTCDFWGWIGGLANGMADMFSISIVAVLIAGLIGLIRYNGGIEWVVNAITSRINSRKGAEYGIGLLSGILSAALVNNTIAIIMTAPMAKEIGGKYGIPARRLASLIDIFACAFIALIPHDGGILICTALAGCSPIEVLKYQFYMFALIISACATIQFGLFKAKDTDEVK